MIKLFYFFKVLQILAEINYFKMLLFEKKDSYFLPAVKHNHGFGIRVNIHESVKFMTWVEIILATQGVQKP